MRNYVNENIHHSGKNGGYYTCIPIYVGMAVKVTKEHYNTGTDQITLIGSNADVVNFYAGLDEDDIESAGKVDINSAGIDELKSLPGIGEKTAEKIINKRNELGEFNTLEDLMLVSGIGSKTFKKLLSYIQIN
ncbi:MAG: helix-hairpin-helix domain-containing protein [Candidatus Marinimicrobia bacterium]|nr:helix-hairpin-helix domain-containing protein [Candidatus Neomarinimicrobiota bacterium]